MALLKRDLFEKLAAKKGNHCISMYIPTLRSGDNKEAMIRYKNQLSAIESELRDLGLEEREIKAYLDPVIDLMEQQSAWRYLSDALVIFRSSDHFFSTTLPIQTNDFYLISGSYYLIPLFSLFESDDSFYLLRISLNHNSLYQANRYEIEEIITDDLFPENIQDSAGRDVVQKSLQFRSQQSGGGHAQYHGKGEGKDDRNEELIKYLNDINKGLSQLLSNKNQPLVVTSVGEVFANFKQVCSYGNLYPDGIEGNYDNENILKVHELACDLLQPYFDRARTTALRNYMETPDKWMADLKLVVKSANEGKIDHLFLERNRHVWGFYNGENDHIDIHSQKQLLDHCLINQTAINVFLKGGNVYLLDGPDQMRGKNKTMFATLRY